MRPRLPDPRFRVFPGATLAAAFLFAAGSAEAQSVRDFLRSRGFSGGELAALDRGEAIGRTFRAEVVAANDTAEVAVGGVVRVDVPRQTFIEAVRNVRGFRNDGMLKMGIIALHPRASDFEALALPPDDVKDLRGCRPGSCAVKLVGPDIAELHAKVHWRAPDHAQQVNRLAREKLLSAMVAYVREGTPAFHALEDKSTKVSIDEQLRQLLANTPDLLAYYPEIHAYMLEFPRKALPGSESVFYWSLNDFGLKPTLTLTHAAGYAPLGSEDVVVLWKQLYATHYFNGSLGVTVYRAEPGASYVLHVDRVRADSLGGAFGGIKRSKMAKAMEGSLKKFLDATKRNLRAQAGPKPPTASTP